MSEIHGFASLAPVAFQGIPGATSLIDFLKYGVIGLALALNILAFWLCWRTLSIYQQWGAIVKKDPHQTEGLLSKRQLWVPAILSAVFMALTVVVLVIAIRLPREPIEVTVALRPAFEEIDEAELKIYPSIRVLGQVVQIPEKGASARLLIKPETEIAISSDLFLNKLRKLQRDVELLKQAQRIALGGGPE